MTERRFRLLAGVIVALPMLAYPVVVLADGRAQFPTRDECVRPVVDDEPVQVVFARLASPDEAVTLRHRVVSAGFVGTQTAPDGCGRWVVVLGNVPDQEIGYEVIREAQSVDLHATLEDDPGN